MTRRRPASIPPGRTARPASTPLRNACTPRTRRSAPARPVARRAPWADTPASAAPDRIPRCTCSTCTAGGRRRRAPRLCRPWGCGLSQGPQAALGLPCAVLHTLRCTRRRRLSPAEQVAVQHAQPKGVDHLAQLVALSLGAQQVGARSVPGFQESAVSSQHHAPLLLGSLHQRAAWAAAAVQAWSASRGSSATALPSRCHLPGGWSRGRRIRAARLLSTVPRRWPSQTGRLTGARGGAASCAHRAPPLRPPPPAAAGGPGLRHAGAHLVERVQRARQAPHIAPGPQQTT